jgi:predicted membrane chloride channel (bestrophin family)
MVTKLKLIWRIIWSDHYAVTTGKGSRVLWFNNAIKNLNTAVVMAEALQAQHSAMMDNILATATDEGRLHELSDIISGIERIK